MAEEGDREDKTESATPKRRDDAREQGQVAMSTDAIAAAGLVASAVVLVVGGGMLASSTGMLVRGACLDVGALGRMEFTENEWAALVTQSVKALGVPTMTIILPLLAVVMLAAYAQSGLKITPKAIAWNPGRLNPMQGFGRVFSTRGVVRTFSAFVKITIVTCATC